MQYPSNQFNDGTRSRKKVLVAIIIMSVVFLLLLFFFLGTNRNNLSPSPEGTGQYTDPITGETVSDPDNKTDESFGTDRSDIVFLGLSKLTSVGLTVSHTENFENAFRLYSEQNNNVLTEVSIYPDSINKELYDPEVGINTVNMRVFVNRTEDYLVRVEYSGITESRTTISSIDGGVLFISGLIDSSADGYTGDGAPPE